MNLVSKRLGKRVRQLRLQRGWTQEELAARSGKHWTYIGGIERGERNPTVSVLGDIARALEIKLGELFIDSSKVSR